MEEGHRHEAAGTPTGLQEAIAWYRRALDAAQGQGNVYGQALAWMNFANASQRLTTPAGRDDARQGYAAAITLLQDRPSPSERASLAAAWMNRGLLHVQEGSLDLAEAVHCLEQARAVFTALPLDAHPAFRCNAAAAALNLSSAWMQKDQGASPAARTAAQEAIELARPLAGTDRTAAVLQLAATQQFCAVTRGTWAGADEAAREARSQTSDRLDDALALVRDWEQRAPGQLQAPARQIFRIAARFYAQHLPRFTAEFLAENLDPTRAPATWAADPQVRAVATEAAARAWHLIQNERLSRAPQLAPDWEAAAAELDTLRHTLLAA